MGSAIHAEVRVGLTPKVVLVLLIGLLWVFGLETVARSEARASEKEKVENQTQSLVYLDTPDGRRLFEESTSRESFVPLSMHLVTQDNLSYCGVATSVVVLNAAGIERPISPEHSPFKLFTQTNLFNDKVRQIARPEQVRRAGMTLETLGKLLGSFPVKVEVVYARERSLGSFRKTAVDTLKNNNSFLIVNYLRKAIGQESAGHISPIGAYHEGEDRFLILDVSRYKYPPVWVKAVELWKAMEAIDRESNRSRGYIIVTKTSKE